MSTHPTTITAAPGTPFLDVTRDFHSTPAQLFRACTDPKLVAQWLGPRDLEIEIVEYDARPGGRYRYIHRGRCEGDEQVEAAFHGVFHTVDPHRLIVQTFEFEGVPGEVCLDI
jgi:uncharacterized protein YndB with AHSA1/START domain